MMADVGLGLVAQACGAPFSVVSGGLGCLAAVVWTASRTPALRRYRREERAAGVLARPVGLGTR